MLTHQETVQFIWQVADLLRDVYRPSQYERVMLPLTVLRRFDCVLHDTKPQVLAEYERIKDKGWMEEVIERRLAEVAKQRFHNHSEFDFATLKGDPNNIAQHLKEYIEGFSFNVRTIFDYFQFDAEIATLNETNLLYPVVSRFSDVNLHPERVDNHRMGLLFEELIRRFNEQANETAGDYFTPREVIRLMVKLLFTKDDALLGVPGTMRKLLDPACGTGGMLSEAQTFMEECYKDAHLYVYGQDINKRAIAIAASDLLIKEEHPTGQKKNDVRLGDSFVQDRFREEKFDYFLANPPFGVDWKRQKKDIEEEARRGNDGRFEAGLPRVSDGALLFLQHMISKFVPFEPNKPKGETGGSRLAIVFNGSPLFSGGAGSGESDIRKWIIEKNDWLEAIIALPEQMFYNTGITTYIWIVTNRKPEERKGKIQLIDARERWLPMRKSLGNKRRRLGEGKRLNPVTGLLETDDPRDDIADIVKEHGNFVPTPTCKIYDNTDFGYCRVTVERPLRLRFQVTLDNMERFLNAFPEHYRAIRRIEQEFGRDPQLDWNEMAMQIREVFKQERIGWTANEWRVFRAVFCERDPDAAAVIKSEKGGQVEYEPDAELRDFENIPLKTDVDAYFAREVLPHVPDAWMDRAKDKIGYEINFNRQFAKYTPPPSLKEIDAKISDLEDVFANCFNIVATVTKGLTTGTPLKDSGIEYLGQIPSHWGVVRLKDVATYNDDVLPEDTDPDYEFDYVEIGDVERGRGIVNKTRMTFESAPSRARRRVREGDIIISTVRTYLEAVAPISKENADVIVSTGFAVIRPRPHIFPEYLQCALLDPRFIFEVTANSVGVSYPAIASADLACIPVLLPPIEEQRQIATFIKESQKNMETLESELLQTVTVLQSRRAALINQAITGKLSLGK